MSPRGGITSEPVPIEERDAFYSDLDTEASKVAEQNPYTQLDIEAASTGFDTVPDQDKPSYVRQFLGTQARAWTGMGKACLLYTSPSPRDRS